jgi:hypothetical protein
VLSEEVLAFTEPDGEMRALDPTDERDVETNTNGIRE